MSFSVPGIHGSQEWRSIEALTLGWSSDKKYIVTDRDGRKLLLRTANEAQFAVKQAEYRLVGSISQLDINASRPVDFGRFEGGVYTLYTWVEGESMEQALPTLRPDVQYALGMEAGRMLRRIHALPAPEHAEEWSVRMNRKMSRKIRMALDCEMEIPGRDRMIDYIEAHRQLLNNRQQSMQHGDYHCGNLLLTPEGHVGVIDFNRFDAGDPWEEFNRIVWCAQRSGAFASGRINGYFENDVPADFFPLVSMYIFSNQLSSLPWAIPFGQQEIDVMLCQANEVLSWYDGLTRDVPNWYLTPEQAACL